MEKDGKTYDGTMMDQGIERLGTTPRDVVQAVGDACRGVANKGSDWIVEHPTETGVALVAAVGGIRLLAPGAALAQGPEVPIYTPEQIKGAVDALTGGQSGKAGGQLLQAIVEGAQTVSKAGQGC